MSDRAWTTSSTKQTGTTIYPRGYQRAASHPSTEIARNIDQSDDTQYNSATTALTPSYEQAWDDAEAALRFQQSQSRYLGADRTEYYQHCAELLRKIPFLVLMDCYTDSLPRKRSDLCNCLRTRLTLVSPDMLNEEPSDFREQHPWYEYCVNGTPDSFDPLGVLKSYLSQPVRSIAEQLETTMKASSGALESFREEMENFLLPILQWRFWYYTKCDLAWIMPLPANLEVIRHVYHHDSRRAASFITGMDHQALQCSAGGGLMWSARKTWTRRLLDYAALMRHPKLVQKVIDMAVELRTSRNEFSLTALESALKESPSRPPGRNIWIDHPNMKVNSINPWKPFLPSIAFLEDKACDDELLTKCVKDYSLA